MKKILLSILLLLLCGCGTVSSSSYDYVGYSKIVSSALPETEPNDPLIQKYVYWYNICLVENSFYFKDANEINPADLLTMFMFFTVNDQIETEQWFRRDEKDNEGQLSCYVVPADTVYNLLSLRLRLSDCSKLKTCKEYEPLTNTFRFHVFAAWSEGLGIHGIIKQKDELGEGTFRLHAVIYGGDDFKPAFYNTYTIQEYDGGYRYLAVERVETYDPMYELGK